MRRLKGERFKGLRLKVRNLFLVFTIIWHLSFVIYLYAGVPQRINYQGRLLDSSGQPVADGSYNITFKIYNVSSGGVALWSEAQSVSTEGGLFNVILGSVNSITLAFNQDYWLGIKVGADSEMTPRHKLVTVPYSFRAEEANDAEKLNSQSASYYRNASNINAGILNDARLSSNVTKLGSSIEANEITPNIVSSLDGVSNDGGNIDLVEGTNITITPNDVANTITISASGGVGDNLGNHTATQNIKLNGYYLSGDGGNEGVYVDDSGNVGIGTTSPTQKLQVGGDFVVTGSRVGIGTTSPSSDTLIDLFYDDPKIVFRDAVEGSNFYIQNWDGDFRILDADKQPLMIVGQNGNVGIGTMDINQKLTVNGNIQLKNSIYFESTPEIRQTGSQFYMYSGDDQGFDFYSDETFRLRIKGNETIYADTSGNVGIGTTGPKSNLHIAKGSSGGTPHAWSNGYTLLAIDSNEEAYINFLTPNNRGAAIYFGNDSNNKIGGIYYNHWFDYMSFKTNDSEGMIIDSSGRVGIGTTSPSHPLHMGSGAYCSAAGVWTDASSRKYKENIRKLTKEEAISALKQLNPVKFNYKIDKKDEYVGFISEDVPKLVATKDRKGLSPMDIVAVLTKVIQEQQERISALEKEIKQLKNR